MCAPLERERGGEGLLTYQGLEVSELTEAGKRQVLFTFSMFFPEIELLEIHESDGTEQTFHFCFMS